MGTSESTGDNINLGNVHEGALYIDAERGVVTFLSKDGFRLLRVTHLQVPVPAGTSIDVVAINQITSYTPLIHESAEGYSRGGKSGLAEWKDRNG